MESSSRGHRIIWHDGKWSYADDLTPIDKIRPCAKCGLVFEEGKPDPCLGHLPGVVHACCGHGAREYAYVQFTNGVTIREFRLE